MPDVPLGGGVARGGLGSAGVLVLALDTATTRITVGVLELAADGALRTAARADAEGARAHAELLAPAIGQALDTAGLTRLDLDAVVCGVGPGPFTGLRVGMVTASALGDGLGLPVHGAATHAALLHDAAGDAPSGTARLAVTDARRREVYWALADVGGDVTGPGVTRPADLVEQLAAVAPGRVVAVGDAAGAVADLVVAGGHATELVVVDRPGPSPASLVAVAAPALLAGGAPDPLVPLYLRRPDAVPPGAPKAVRR